jgi:acyl carrier protein
VAEWRAEREHPATSNGKHKPASEETLPAEDPLRLAARIESWLAEWLVERGGVPREQVAGDRPFADYGLSSLVAVELSQDLERWLGIELSSVIAWKYPTPESLSVYLAQAVAGGAPSSVSVPRRRRGADAFLRLLEEIEALGDGEANK